MRGDDRYRVVVTEIRQNSRVHCSDHDRFFLKPSKFDIFVHQESIIIELYRWKSGEMLVYPWTTYRSTYLTRCIQDQFEGSMSCPNPDP